MSEDRDVEKFKADFQKEILEKLRAVYSEAVVERCIHPKNFESIENPHGYAKSVGSCGDRMEIFIRMKDERILECAFQTDGCATTVN